MHGTFDTINNLTPVGRLDCRDIAGSSDSACNKTPWMEGGCTKRPKEGFKIEKPKSYHQSYLNSDIQKYWLTSRYFNFRHLFGLLEPLVKFIKYKNSKHKVQKITIN